MILLLQIVYISLLFIICTSFGNLVINVVFPSLKSSETERLISLPAGILLSIFLISILCWSRLLYPSVYIPLFILIILTALYNIKNCIRMLRKIFSDLISVYTKDTFTLFCGVTVVIVMVMAFISSIAPTTSIDATVYHYSVPLLYKMNNGVVNLPIWHSNLPLNNEMLLLIGNLFRSTHLSGAFSWLIGFCTMVILTLVCLKRFNSLAAAIVSVIFSTSLNVFSNITSADADIGVAFFGLISFILILDYISSKQNTYLYCSIIFASFSVGYKYTGVVFLVIIFLVEIYHLFRKEIRFHPTKYLVCILLFTLFGCGWYIKNWILNGNPLFPMGLMLFNQNPSDYFFPKPITSSTHYPKTFIGFLTFPWRITVGLSNFKYIWQGTWSPFIVAFLPVAIIKGHKKSIIRLSIIAFILFWIFSFSMPKPLPRYSIPFLTVLFLPAAFGISEFYKMGRLFKTLSIIIISLITLSHLGLEIGKSLTRTPYAFSLETEEEFIKKYASDIDRAAFYLKNVNDDPNSNRTLLLDERSYYFLKNKIPTVIADQYYKKIDFFIPDLDYNQLLEKLSALDINYIVFDDRILKKKIKAYYSDFVKWIDTVTSKSVEIGDARIIAIAL